MTGKFGVTDSIVMTVIAIVMVIVSLDVYRHRLFHVYRLRDGNGFMYLYGDGDGLGNVNRVRLWHRDFNFNWVRHVLLNCNGVGFGYMDGVRTVDRDGVWDLDWVGDVFFYWNCYWVGLVDWIGNCDLDGVWDWLFNWVRNRHVLFDMDWVRPVDGDGNGHLDWVRGWDVFLNVDGVRPVDWNGDWNLDWVRLWHCISCLLIYDDGLDVRVS